MVIQLVYTERIQVSKSPELRFFLSKVRAWGERTESPRLHRVPDRSQAVGPMHSFGAPSPHRPSVQTLLVLLSQHFMSNAQLRNDDEYSSPGWATVTWLSAYTKSELGLAGGKLAPQKASDGVGWEAGGVLWKWLPFLQWLARCHPQGKAPLGQGDKHSLGLKVG